MDTALSHVGGAGVVRLNWPFSTLCPTAKGLSRLPPLLTREEHANELSIGLGPLR